MVTGGNSDNRTHRERIRKQILADGRCSLCPPHGGENDGAHGHRHGYYKPNFGGFVPTKRKAVK